MNQHLPPQIQGGAVRDIRFVELDIPRTLAAHTPLLSGLSSFFRPSQEMVNFASKELARASSKDPPYKPYPTPNLHSHPWMPETADHLADQAQWKSYAKSSKKVQLPLELSIQRFLLYQLRFLLAADLCSAWAGFGGLGAQLCHLSIALNIAVIETVGLALTYHAILSSRMSEKARQRSTSEAEFISTLSADQFGVREQAKRDVDNLKPPTQKQQLRKLNGNGHLPNRHLERLARHALPEKKRPPRDTAHASPLAKLKNRTAAARGAIQLLGLYGPLPWCFPPGAQLYLEEMVT